MVGVILFSHLCQRKHGNLRKAPKKKVKNGSYPGDERLNTIENIVKEMDKNIAKLKGTMQPLNNALDLTNKMKNSYVRELKELKKQKNMNLCAVCGSDYSFDMSAISERSETDNSPNPTPSQQSALRQQARSLTN